MGINIIEGEKGLAKEELYKLIMALSENSFYGKLTISFENGRILVLKKEETIKSLKN